MRYRHGLRWLLTLTAMGALGAIGHSVSREVRIEAAFLPSEIKAAKESVAVSLMGQVQMSVADMVWVKTWEYLHRGVRQRMPTPSEEAIGYLRQGSYGTIPGLSHTEGVTMVPSRRRDWRGWVGEVHRHVKPYDVDHDHDSPEALTPWFRLALRINPHMDKECALAGVLLAEYNGEPAQAMRFLERMLRVNPNSFEIRAVLGRLVVTDATERHDAQALRRAVVLLQEAIVLADNQRKEMAARRLIFDNYQNEAFAECYFWLAVALERLDRTSEALSAAVEGTLRVPNHYLKALHEVMLAKSRGERPAETDWATVEDYKRGESARIRDRDKRYRHLDNIQSETPEPVGTGPIQIVRPDIPVALLLGIDPPADEPEPAAHERSVLADVRAHPGDTVGQRASRLGLSNQAVADALAALTERRFVEESTFLSARRSEPAHCVTPIGLYVDMGIYDFNFWAQSTREIAALPLEVRNQHQSSPAISSAPAFPAGGPVPIQIPLPTGVDGSTDLGSLPHAAEETDAGGMKRMKDGKEEGRVE